MNLKPIYAIFLRYWFLLRDSPQRIFQILVWAGINVILWGFLTQYLNQVGNSGVNFTITLLGAVMLWEFLVRIQQGISTPALEDIWARNLLNMFGSPLRVTEYALG